MLFDSIDTKYPYLYVIGSKGSRLEIFNTSEMETMRGLEFRERGLRSFAVSGDGKQFLIANSSNKISLVDFSERDLVAKQVKVHPEKAKTDTELRSHVKGKYWSIDNQLWNKGLTKKTGEFPGKYLGVHPRLDLVLSFDMEKLVISSLVSGKALGTIESMETPLPAFGIKPEIWFVDNAKTAFVACRNRAYLVPLNRFMTGATELVGIQQPTTTSGTVGKELTIPLEPTNLKQKARLRYSLVKGPKTARIRGNQIVWTPQKADLGKHDFLVKATLGKQAGELNFQLEIQPDCRHVELGSLWLGVFSIR